MTEQIQQEPEQNFKVIVNVIRDRKQDHDKTITFTLLLDRKSNFGEIFQKFLKELPVIFRIKATSVDDSVTHQPVQLFLEIESFGQQIQIVSRLQQYILVLSSNCSDIK